MTFGAITIEERSADGEITKSRDIKLRYRAESIMTIEKLAGKKIGPSGLKFIEKQSGFEFSASDKIPIELVMGFMDMDFETMLWIWSFGLDWKESGAKKDEAMALYDAYMEMEDPDGGDRFKAFKMLAIDAINAARGIDTKKLQEANKIAREKQIVEQETAIAREMKLRKDAKDMIGTEQPDSASET
jgi:hypothetical protein